MSDPVPVGWDAHVHVFDAARPVRPGHYRPPHRPLNEIESIASAQGVGHLVLVQPSVYGADHTLLAEALRTSAGRHRGVAVVDDTVADDALDELHALGVRGARLNLVSPVGERSDPARRHADLARRIARLGWHIQWYAGPRDLPLVAALHAGAGPTCVLDHLAGLGLDVPADAEAWTALEALAARGSWLKLSGWYRLGAEPPYTSLVDRVRRCAALFGDRLVWGSDWPHTFFANDAATPSYASSWQIVVDALGQAAADAIRCRMPAIYAP